MRVTLMLACAAMALTGCQTNTDPVDDTPPAPDQQAMPAPVSLAGEYRVAGIDGSEVGGNIGIALSITDKTIWFEPRCAGFSWTYTYSDGVLATDRPQKPRKTDGGLVAGVPAPTCRIAVHPEQQRLATALDTVTRAERTPSNGIELTGGGHSVTLYSQ